MTLKGFQYTIYVFHYRLLSLREQNDSDRSKFSLYVIFPDQQIVSVVSEK